MLLHRMDRHGPGAGPRSINADCDVDCNLRTHGNGNPFDSNPNPQPDPVDRHGHHHEYNHLHFHIDALCDSDPFAHPVPACHRNIYFDFNVHGNCHFYAYTNANSLCHPYHHPYLDAIPYILPYNSRRPITL